MACHVTEYVSILLTLIMRSLFTRDQDLPFESEGVDVSKLNQTTEVHATTQAKTRSYNTAINKISREACAVGEEHEKEQAT